MFNLNQIELRFIKLTPTDAHRDGPLNVNIKHTRISYISNMQLH